MAGLTVCPFYISLLLFCLTHYSFNKLFCLFSFLFFMPNELLLLTSLIKWVIFFLPVKSSSAIGKSDSHLELLGSELFGYRDCPSWCNVLALTVVLHHQFWSVLHDSSLVLCFSHPLFYSGLLRALLLIILQIVSHSAWSMWSVFLLRLSVQSSVLPHSGCLKSLAPSTNTAYNAGAQYLFDRWFTSLFSVSWSLLSLSTHHPYATWKIVVVCSSTFSSLVRLL